MERKRTFSFFEKVKTRTVQRVGFVQGGGFVGKPMNAAKAFLSACFLVQRALKLSVPIKTIPDPRIHISARDCY